MGDLRRLYVGGLFENASEGDVKEQFSRFGKVDSVEIKVKRDFSGNLIKKFAYVDLHADDALLKKCFAAYNKTKWKGSELKIQLAKEDFLKRLQEERNHQSDEDQDVVSEHVSFEEKFDENRLTSKTPGSLVPGEKNWVVGKYGRILPVVHIRRKDKQKVTKIDPTKYSHNLKKIKETDNTTDEPLDLDNLTWSIEEKNTENDRKRKGIFPEWQDKKSAGKKKMNDGIMSINTTFKGQYGSAIDDDDMEICEVGTVKLTELPGFVRKKPLSGGYDSSYDSAGTDEIIAISKSKSEQIVNKKSDSDEEFPRSNSCGQQIENRQNSRTRDRIIAIPESKSKQIVNKSDSDEKISSWNSGGQHVEHNQNSRTRDRKKLGGKLKQKIPEFKGIRAAFSDESEDETSILKRSQHTVKSKSHSQSPKVLKSVVNDSESSSEEEANCNSHVTRYGNVGTWKDKSKESSVEVTDNKESSCTDSDDELTTDSDEKIKTVKRLTKKHSDKHMSTDSKMTTDDGKAGIIAGTRHRTDQNLEKNKLPKERKALQKDEPVIGNNNHVSKAYQGVTKAVKHEDDNRKRIASLIQKQKDNATQKSLIQQALANVDHLNAGNTPNKRHNFFDSDSDEDISDESMDLHKDLQHISSNASSSDDDTFSEQSSSQDTTASDDDDSDDEASESESDVLSDEKHEESSKITKSKKPLFDSESDDDSESEDAFEHKPQFEGKKGSELMKLQARFQSDKRFKMNERFLESDSSDDEAEEERKNSNEDNSGEKLRSLKILQEVMGGKVKVDLHDKNKQKKIFKDISSLQYDPSKEDHKQFEREAVAAPKKKKIRVPANKDTEDASPQNKIEVKKPKVSKDKYFQVESSLTEAFRDKDVIENSGFSLLQQFGKVESGDEEELETTEHTETIIKRQNPLLYDSSSDEGINNNDDFDDEMSQDQSTETKTEGSKDSVVIFPSKKATFFFTEDDDRFKVKSGKNILPCFKASKEQSIKTEGEEFYRKENLEDIRWNWLNQKDELVKLYKSRHKKSTMKRARQNTKKFLNKGKEPWKRGKKH